MSTLQQLLTESIECLESAGSRVDLSSVFLRIEGEEDERLESESGGAETQRNEDEGGGAVKMWKRGDEQLMLTTTRANKVQTLH